jgi:4-hydroxyisophthalate hydroxylase
VYEELGRGFTLLAFDVDEQTVGTFERAAAALGMPLKIIRDTYLNGRTAYESRLILVRPDQYVVWTGDSVPDNPGGLMRKVIGRN